VLEQVLRLTHSNFSDRKVNYLHVRMFNYVCKYKRWPIANTKEEHEKLDTHNFNAMISKK